MDPKGIRQVHIVGRRLQLSNQWGLVGAGMELVGRLCLLMCRRR